MARESWIASLALSILLIFYRLAWNWDRFQWLSPGESTYTVLAIFGWGLICFLTPPLLVKKIHQRRLRLMAQLFLHGLVYIAATFLGYAWLGG